ncbi:MAG: hypothetical protein MUF00_11290 [Gemmatimonadaceae bacterium]|jgi:hypothetical protein|nr:hypothetical protein [Gemmatimonadaceae bacterium]
MSTLTRAAARAEWQASEARVAPLMHRAEVMPGQLAEAWRAVEDTLRVLVAQPDAAGQALITAARQYGVLSLEETHALLEALAVASRATERPDVALAEGDVSLVREGVQVVDTLCRDDRLTVPPIAGAPTAMSDPAMWAPPSISSAPSATRATSASEWAPPQTTATPRDAASWAPPSLTEPAATGPDAGVLAMPAPSPASGGGRTAALVVGGVVLLIAGVALGALFSGGSSRSSAATAPAVADSPALADCRTAFERRDFARAQVACGAAAAQARQRPSDAIALVYLSRMKRAAGDLQGAIADADLAQRLLPVNGIALRELGAAFLDAGNPGEARRAFVAAVENDRADQVAMAGLACALHRMGRIDEGRRWRERSRVSAFDACLAAPPGR